MDTLTFLQKILPSKGHYVLANFKDGMSKKPSHYCRNTIGEIAALATSLDAQGGQVFHACASFVEPRKRTAKLSDGRVVQAENTRGQDNVAFTRSQWLDVDVGEGKDYPDAKTALAAIVKMCSTLGIPAPMLVRSGRGWHCYWPFKKDLAGKAAQVLANAFRCALKDIGFKHDPSRTADLASILRPVGSHWRKDGVVEVTLFRDASPVSATRLIKQLAKYIEPEKPAHMLDVSDEWSSGTRTNYPPSSADRIVQQCGALREVADARGEVAEPLWRAMLGLVKHTVEGEERAHEWSKGYSGYSASETQEKLDNWTAGPTTCSAISDLCGACARCPHADKVSSPIHLGYAEDLPPRPVEPEASAEQDAVTDDEPDLPADGWSRRLPDELPYWVKGYGWDGNKMSKFMAVKDDDGNSTMQWVAFCDRLFYPYLRHPSDDGTYVVKISALIDSKRSKWREFDIPAKTVSEPNACAAALGAYELYSVGAKGKELMRQCIQDFLGSMQEHAIETTLYNGFGWHDDGFVIGTTQHTPKGLKPIFLGERVPASSKVDHGIKGSAEEWARLINTIYNRPGAEPYQFILMAAFGAPLVYLTESEMWHGIPIALTGDGGLGKTTTCKVACSAFGKPGLFTLSANEAGTTMNALIKHVAVMRHLPLVLDEMTGRTPRDLQDMLYALSNGQPKIRLTTTGNQVGGDLKWDTISFITGNMNITGMLSTLDRVKADATQMRCFEIPLSDDFNERVFSGLNAKDLIETQLLPNQYGAAGQKYINYVMLHREAIRDRLQRLRVKLAPITRDETRERFYLDCLAMALVGGALAKKLGLIEFDLEGVRKWAMNHIKSLRVRRAASSYGPEDYFQAFLSSLHGRTVVTNHFGDARSKERGIELVDESRLRNPVARHAIRDRRFLVTANAWNDWCADNQVNPTWLRDELDKRGYFASVEKSGTNKDERIRIFKGSNVTGGVVRCMEFEYDKIDSAVVKPRLTVVDTAEKEAV